MPVLRMYWPSAQIQVMATLATIIEEPMWSWKVVFTTVVDPLFT